MQIHSTSNILSDKSSLLNIFNNNYNSKHDKHLIKNNKKRNNINNNNVSTEDSDRYDNDKNDFKLPSLTVRNISNFQENNPSLPVVEKQIRSFSSPTGGGAGKQTSRRWNNLANNQFNYNANPFLNIQDKGSGSKFEADIDEFGPMSLNKNNNQNGVINNFNGNCYNFENTNSKINSYKNIKDSSYKINLPNKFNQENTANFNQLSFGLEGNIIKSYRQDKIEKEKEKIEKENAKIEKIFNHQKNKINQLRNRNQEFITSNINSDDSKNNKGISFNEKMITIDEIARDDYDDLEDYNSKLMTARKPERSNSTHKLRVMKSIKKKEEAKLLEQKEQEKKELDKAMKFRFFIENMNGFWQLFRSKIKLNKNDWVEVPEMDFLTCSYVHHQKNLFNKALKWLPKNEDDKLAFYKDKQTKILEQIETSNNLNNQQMKKLEKIQSIPLNTESQFNQYYCIFSHLENNEQICSKEGLHKNLSLYYKLNNLDIKTSLLPLTFHVNHKDPSENQWAEFKEQASCTKEKVWIVKPGVDSNKGQGIKVFDSIDAIEQQTQRDDQPKWVVQKQIEKPLLIKGRKFDIRIYGLLTSLHGNMKGQFFKYAYIRTNSAEYSLKNLEDPLVHLSNDAIQAKDKENQGKQEDHNKMSVAEFTREYLYPRTKNFNYFYEILWPKMRDEFQRLIMQTKLTLDPHRRHHGFEVLGMDFMLDNSLNLQFIEINSNPALGTFGCKVLENVIFPFSNDSFNLSVNKLFHCYQDNDKTNKNQEIIQDDSKHL